MLASWVRNYGNLMSGAKPAESSRGTASLDYPKAHVSLALQVTHAMGRENDEGAVCETSG